MRFPLLTCIVVLLAFTFFEEAVATSKKITKISKDSVEDDGEKSEDQNEKEKDKPDEEENKDKVNDWRKVLEDGWKSFKIPSDGFGVPSFLDMHQCLSQNFKTAFAKHPDIGLSLHKVIEAHGYPWEKYKVQTEDGYSLALHRIPYSPKSPKSKGPKKAILLNHGLGANGHEYVLQWDKSLAFLLADAGYDVWLGNMRGTKYSKTHEDKDPKGADYWDFSFHEIGIHDIPTTINAILEISKESSIYYVGHGYSTTAYVVALSENPDLNKKIKMGFMLGLSVYLFHSKHIFKNMAPLAQKAKYRKYPMMGGEGEAAQLTFEKFKLKETYNKACQPPLFSCFGCSNLYYSIGGFNGAETNYTNLPLIASLFPDKISTKTVVHLAQHMSENKFGQFDYGTEVENVEKYGEGLVDYPPSYDLSKVTAPMTVFIGRSDAFATPEDVEHAVAQFPKGTVKQTYIVDKFQNGDFVTGIHAKEKVYDKILKVLSKDKDVEE